MSSSRDETLALLGGQPIERLPVFSGLPSLTAPGLAQAGLRYADVHADAGPMARAAASTFELFGFESVVVPFDLCVEAEALGSGVDFEADADGFLAPAVSAPLNLTPDRAEMRWPDRPEIAGRIPVVAEALRQLKVGVGREVAVGAWVPGPFTLGWQLFGAEAWLSALGERARAGELLAALADFLAQVGRSYRAAGADFLTVHEMGGSPQVTGPRLFRALVQPALAHLISALPAPAVLSMCGDTNPVVGELAACGAAALHVDQRNDLARTRAALGPGTILVGNIDPVGVLSWGTPDQVTQSVQDAAAAGVNAIWPGCDLWPEIPTGNFHALMEAARRFQRDDSSI